MKKLETVRLELRNYFGNGTNFCNWEKEFGILNTSIIRTEEEAIAYYEKVIDVIRAVFETLSWSERTDGIVRLINNYVFYYDYDTEEIKNDFLLYNQAEEDFETKTDDSFLDDLYNELVDAVAENRYMLFEEQRKYYVEHNSFEKDEEFISIYNSLPLDQMLMKKIIKGLF